MSERNASCQPLRAPLSGSAERDPDIDRFMDWLTLALTPDRGAAIVDRVVTDDAFRAKAEPIEDQIGQILDAMSWRGSWVGRHQQFAADELIPRRSPSLIDRMKCAVNNLRQHSQRLGRLAVRLAQPGNLS